MNANLTTGLRDIAAALVALDAQLDQVAALRPNWDGHGAPSIDLTGHPCGTIGKCIPEKHPPKTECIKCHRMAPTMAPTMPPTMPPTPTPTIPTP